MNSTLYVGRVTHNRLRPRKHALAYRAYWLLLDLDEIDGLAAGMRLISHNRMNLFSFYDCDHGLGTRETLRSQIYRHLATAGIDLDGGAVRLLAMPRLLGYAFNPLSIFYCHRRDGSLAALIYEVHNTFKERHSYLIAVAQPDDRPIRQNCAKRFYVSPFLDMEMRYDFSVNEPDGRVSVVIKGSDADGDLIVASLAGKRVPLTDSALLRVFVTHPLLTLKVMAGIHWEAFRLWLKGLRFYERPPAPTAPVTVTKVPASTRSRS